MEATDRLFDLLHDDLGGLREEMRGLRSDFSSLRSDFSSLQDRLVQIGFGLVFVLASALVAVIVAVAT